MQIRRRGIEEMGRLIKRLAERPGALAACVVALLLALGAGVFGVAQAAVPAVTVERGGGGAAGADDVPGGEAVPGDEVVEEPDSEPETVVVDVGGAVLSPGVVELPAGARVAEAIERAGGLAEDADTATLNQAAILMDGQKILVPREGEGDDGADDPVAAVPGAPAAPDLVNINSATLAELDTLPGVGPSTAQAIVDDRAQNGPFASTEDLMRVSGIGEKKFTKLESMICV